MAEQEPGSIDDPAAPWAPRSPRAEPEDAGCEPIPSDLTELHEVLEWQAAVRRQDEAAGQQLLDDDGDG